MPPQAGPVHINLPVWGVDLFPNALPKKKKKSKKHPLGVLASSTPRGMPSSGGTSTVPMDWPVYPPVRARGGSSPSPRLPESALFFFFKRGPISFTNEGPTVPGRICYGPARRPGGIVLPSAPTGAHCPRPQRGLLAADLSGPASRRSGPPLRSWPRRWGLSPGDL